MRVMLPLLLLAGCSTVPEQCPDGQELERISMPVPSYRRAGGMMGPPSPSNEEHSLPVGRG